MVLKLFSCVTAPKMMFENDVKMYGTQTIALIAIAGAMFENDVKMYGTQTLINMNLRLLSLRMM